MATGNAALLTREISDTAAKPAEPQDAPVGAGAGMSSRLHEANRHAATRSDAPEYRTSDIRRSKVMVPAPAQRAMMLSRGVGFCAASLLRSSQRHVPARQQ